MQFFVNRRGFDFLVSILVICTKLTLAGPAAVNSVKPGKPIGEGVFTNLPFKISASLNAGYDDNVFTSHTDRIGSGYNDLSLDIASHVGNQRGRLDADLALGFEYYWDIPGTSIYPNISLNLNSSYKLAPRLILSLSSNLSYQSQPNFSITGAATQFVGNYFVNSSQISLGYELTPRFSTVTSYALTTYLYENSVEAAQQNRFEQLIGEELRYMLFPTATLVGEYRFGYILPTKRPLPGQTQPPIPIRTRTSSSAGLMQH